MQSFENNQSNFGKLKSLVNENTICIIWNEPDVFSNLNLLKQVDYFFNNTLFKRLKSDSSNTDENKSKLNIVLSYSFNNELILIHTKNIKEQFEHLRNTLNEIKKSLTDKEIIIIGDADIYKEKLELSFEKTIFHHLNIS